VNTNEKIEQALRTYRCQFQRVGERHEEVPMPLVDMLSIGYPTIEQGEEEIRLLAEHIADALSGRVEP
jgi:hypothetical protein